MTNRARFIIALCLSFTTVISLAAQQPAPQQPAGVNASIPHLVRFAGVLKEVAGKPVSGSVEITFAIYQDEQGGEPLWMETQPVALDAFGHYSVMLGATTGDGLPQSLFQAGEAWWIEARAAGEAPPTRSLLASVPYALKSVDADSLAGRSAADYVTRDDLRRAVVASAEAAAKGSPQVNPMDTGVTGAGTAGYLPVWTGAATVGNSVIAESGNKVGINTATPATTLDVNGNTTFEGNVSMPALGTATAAGGFNSPVFALSASSFQNGGAAVNQKFAWEVQPQGNNTANPGSVLSLLYASGTNGLANSGLSITRTGSLFSQSNMTVIAPQATSTTAGSSPKLVFEASAFNSSSALSVPQNFALSALPAANNTPNPSANLSLEFSSGSVSPTPTGLSFSPTGIVTFAHGQTFPGAGSITGITTAAGSGLKGGVSSGNASLSLDSSFTDGRYAQLGAINTFTMNQLFNGNVGIGEASPAYPLHVNGVIRSENGLSLGGLAPLSVDAYGSPGGRFTVLANGSVGINNPNPANSLDVVGNMHSTGIIRSELGGLSLGGFAPLSVDSNGTSGGRFVILSKGEVGINNPHPVQALDVGGSITASGSLNGSGLSVGSGGINAGGLVVAGAGLTVGGNVNLEDGTLQIRGDTPMSSAPHMYLTGYVPGPLGANQGATPIFAIPSKSIIITRMTSMGNNTCPSSGPLYFFVYAGGANSSLVGALQLAPYTGTVNPTDSGPLSFPVSAGTPIQGIVQAPNCGSFGTAPSDIPVSIEYVMQ